MKRTLQTTTAHIQQTASCGDIAHQRGELSVGASAVGQQAGIGHDAREGWFVKTPQQPEAMLSHVSHVRSAVSSPESPQIGGRNVGDRRRGECS
jgi:hypothetical protein